MNLYCPGQKAVNQKYRENYDKIFRKDGYKRLREHTRKECPESKSKRMNDKDLNGLINAIKENLKRQERIKVVPMK